MGWPASYMKGCSLGLLPVHLPASLPQPAVQPPPNYHPTLPPIFHTGLDWRTRHELIDVLKQLKAECTMLVVSGWPSGKPQPATAPLSAVI